MERVMDRKFNYSGINESDKNKKISSEKLNWRQKPEKKRQTTLSQHSERHQYLIENYPNLQLGLHPDKRDDMLVNEIRNGIISFGYERMSKFPGRLVEILRHDITHLDLSMNNIRSFDFLRGFKNLKSLVLDGNIHMDMESLPPLDTLVLFYANKCNIEFPRSFIFRISSVFQSLKYLSMMSIPVIRRPSLRARREEQDHRMRMFAIFMNPKLIHFNDKHITEDERHHSETYHKYLGPIDCNLSKFKTLPDTDDLRKILPVFIREKTRHVLSMEAQEDADNLSEALASIVISDYFKSKSIPIEEK